MSAVSGYRITCDTRMTSHDHDPDIRRLMCRTGPDVCSGRRRQRRREVNEKATSKTSLFSTNYTNNNNNFSDYSTTTGCKSHTSSHPYRSHRPSHLLLFFFLTSCCLIHVTLCQGDNDDISIITSSSSTNNNRSAVPAVISDLSSSPSSSSPPVPSSSLSLSSSSAVSPDADRKGEKDDSDSSDSNTILHHGLSAHSTKYRLPHYDHIGDEVDDGGEEEEEDETVIPDFLVPPASAGADSVTTHQSSDASPLSSSSSVSSLSPPSPMSSTAADGTHAAPDADNGISPASASESPVAAAAASAVSSNTSISSNSNKNNLSFTRSEYNVSISESAQGRTFATVIPSPVIESDDVIHIVSPFEKMGIRVTDTGRRIAVKFKIISGDEKKTFKCESRRVGDFIFLLIRTRSSEGTLNREYQELYHLKVRATITTKSLDKRLISRAKVYCDVHVRVEDANDLSPLFYPTTYNIQVPADSAIDSRVRQVTAFDSDTGLNGEIYYSMDGDEQDFAVHPTLGWISVVRPLRRQANQKRQLVIYASDRERGATPIRKSLAANTGSVLAMQSRAVVNVHITPAGTPGVSSSRSRGSDANNSDQYDDSPDDDNDDEEEMEEEDELSSDGRVLHKFKVPENSRFATIVGVINETGSSSGITSNLKYKLLNYKSRFAIDSKSGVLTVKGLIDREDKELYQLYITVSDADTGSTIRQLTAVVTVTDVNDNPPIFRERTYYARVREDLPVGAVIMRMRAVDDDQGLGGRIVYSIRKHPSPPLPSSSDSKQLLLEEDAFTIDDVMGNVRIAKELDFESKQVYNLTIVAKDQGVPAFESTANLLIEVEDVDENQFAPKFKDFVLTGQVKENSPIGTIVMTVDAVDEDWMEGKRGSSERKIWFQLVAGSGIGVFAVDPESGRISTTAVLDREIESRYWLTLVAKDKSPIPKSSHVHVFIEIQDENDSAPCSDQPFYAVSVKENATTDSVVLQISAHDDDLSSAPLDIQYRIVNAEQDAAPFLIDSKTGVLRTRDKLDREMQSQYTLDIEIAEVNPASGHSLMSRTPVIISIENVNDNPPQLVSQIVRCQAYNSLPKEIPVCHVIAYDLDDVSSSSSSSSLMYDIIDGNDYAFFKIDPTKGSIYFAQEKEIPNKAYDLTVSVSDQGSPRRSVTALVIMKVLEKRSLAPNETNSAPRLIGDSAAAGSTVISVTENEMIGKMIAVLSATDADQDPLSIHLMPHGNEAGIFAVNEGALTVSQRIDYEQHHNFQLQLAIFDGIDFTFVNITIDVIDLNDNVPVIQESYSINVFENVSKGQDILSIKVQDADTNEKHSFSIYTSPSPATLELFYMEPWSGVLRLRQPLDHETSRQHVLVVEVADSRFTKLGRPASSSSSSSSSSGAEDEDGEGTPSPTLMPYAASSHRAFTKIVINVLDVNDHPPVFVSNTFESTVFETTAVGTSVAQVIASDADSGNNGLISYSIVSGNVNSVFKISPETGYIFLEKELDVRSQPEYHLVVRASDSGDQPLTSYCNVRIVIIVPDHVAPKFDRTTYFVDVSEATKVNRVIFGGYKVFSKQNLNYQLIATHDVMSAFSMDSYNGEISLKKPLDYEQVKQYEVTMKATNLVGLSDNATLVIHVVDSNDNQPQWNKTTYSGHVSEDVRCCGKPVFVRGSQNKPLTLLAYDLDAGANGELEFYINEPHGRKHFTIDPQTRAVLLKREVEYSKTPSINFTVGVTDLGREQLEAETVAHVSIFVTVPDPMFETKSYTLDLSEDTPVGHVLFNGITGRKQKLLYELIAFPDDRKYLSVEESTGVVALSAPVDAETKKEIRFVVSATNLVGAKDTASFLVNILDANDCSPKWNKSVFAGHISEDAEPGSIVLNDVNTTLTLEAYDEDSSSRNGKLEFYINEPHGMEYFSVNPATGVISLKKQLQYEKKSTIIFTVSVTDLADVPLKGEPDALVVISIEKSTKPTTTTTTTTVTPDPCLAEPCHNNGTCESSEDLLTFNCSCPIGFYGDVCQETKFLCSATKVCKNRGICQERDTDSYCECASGFQGDLCEEDVDECALSDSAICPPPATCINLPGSYRCICSPFLVNGSGTSNYCGSLFQTTTRFNAGSFTVSMDEIIGLICILFMIVLTCCCLSCCWNVKSKSPIHSHRHNRTPAQSYQHHSVGDANEFLLKHSSLNEMSCNIKRFSKISRNDSTTDSALNQRPLSMNNFENVRLVGIVAEENGELYSLSADPQQRPLDQREQLLLQTLKKANPPIVTVTPQVTCNTVCSSSSHGSGSKGKIQNVESKSSASSSIKSTSKRRTSLCDSELNVFNEDPGNSSNAEGYHWDCSDWALINESSNHNHNAKTIHLLEVSSHEVRDSESNSDNSQIELTGDEVQRLNGSGLNGRRKGFVGSSSSSIDTSVENSLTEIRRHRKTRITNGVKEEDEEHEDDGHGDGGEGGGNSTRESSALTTIDDIEFADHSPSDKYVTHPNSYLPVYQSITDMNGSDGGSGQFSSSGSQWISSGDINSTVKTKTAASDVSPASAADQHISLTTVTVMRGRGKDSSPSSPFSLIRNNDKGFDAASDAGSTACDLESTFV